MSTTRKPTGSPLWRQVVDKTPDKKKVVIHDTEKQDHLPGRLNRKTLDQFDSHPRHHPDPEVRNKFNKLFPAAEANKKTDAVTEETTPTNQNTP